MSVTSCPRCRRTYEEGVRFCPVDGALVSQVVHDPNVGRVLMGQFELREIAGRGAMGTVYRAYQRTMDRIVAVKVLRSEIVKEPGVLKRFLREARAAARLQHPNIVTVHMVGETEDGVPYLVMEHIDGVSLEAICEAQGPQPLPRTISFGRQIASALSEAHSLGIVHRDLKPANILVTDRSRTADLVKVLDFGIAKLVHADADQSMMTADGTIFGTPHYIAPEQASGGDVDHRVDLYSLGCILFRLTTGVLPFEGTQSMQVVLKHLREEPPRPRSIDPSISPAMEELILSCLDKSRSKRPDDADAIIAALDRIEADARRPKSERLAPVISRVATPSGSGPRATGPMAPVTTGATGPMPAHASNGAGGHTGATGKIGPVAPVGPVTRGVARGPSPWAMRGVWLGVFLAATLGAGVGVLLALTHNGVDETVPPRPEQHAAVPRTARTHVPPPAVVATVTTAPQPTTATPVAATTATTADTAGRKDPPTRGNPVKTARADSSRRRGQRDEEIPMTVVPADAPAPRVVARPLPVTPASSSTPAPTTPTPTTSAPPATTTVHPPATTAPPPTIVLTPPPPKEPSPRAPKDDEPPPAPPPTASDPTTLPPPTPIN
jgi:serine/threonine protein kinase